MELSVLVLVVSFVILLALSVPIAISIGIATTLTMFVTIPFEPAIITVAQRMASGINSFALLAIPFFILSGQLMGRGGIARRLIDFAKVLVGMLPGGLAIVNILACMFFGAISGSAAAATSAIGGFMIPIMNKEGYDKNFNTAITVTASTTGLLIPPSNVLIVYSLASGGVSIAALFIAGYLPGVLMGLGLMIVASIISIIKKYPTGEREEFWISLKKFLSAIPSLLLIIVVIGGIISGIFTATEASAIAVLYSFILSVFIYKEVKIKELPSVLIKSVETTAIVMLLIGTSSAMSWILSYENTCCRNIHGYDSGYIDFYSNIFTGCHKLRYYSTAFWNNNGNEFMHWVDDSTGWKCIIFRMWNWKNIYRKCGKTIITALCSNVYCIVACNIFPMGIFSIAQVIGILNKN